MLSQIGDEISAKWEGAEAAITHRVGVIDIGEAAVVIAVSSPHRKAAYEANEYAIERIKQIVPIWKRNLGRRRRMDRRSAGNNALSERKTGFG